MESTLDSVIGYHLWHCFGCLGVDIFLQRTGSKVWWGHVCCINSTLVGVRAQARLVRFYFTQVGKIEFESILRD